MATIAITETFEDVEVVMWSVIHKFHRQYGGELEEWQSEGHRIFMRAYTTFRYDKPGSFHNWFKFLLVKLFMEKIRRQAMHTARHKRIYLEMADLCRDFRESFDFFEWAEDLDLSDDAWFVASLVVDPPFDIKLSLEHSDLESRSKVKSVLKEFLRDLGWTTKQIFSAFREIKEAL